MSTVLLVDDEPGILFALGEVLRDRNLTVITASNGAEALTKLDGVDVVVTDQAMPGMSGLELIAAINTRHSQLPVVLLTAHGSEKVAVSAMKAGAYDYLPKPFDIDEVTLVVSRAIEAGQLRHDNQRLAAERALGRRIVAVAPPMRQVLDAAARVASRDVTVLVRGETGTGKEFVAQLLHAHSARVAGPLVRFNCAAIPADLAEAELFGHAKGAFTGATSARRGFFAEADGGTLILDEVGELPLAIQAKLLRVLQDGEIQPVGSGRVERVNVRIVASTNRDLLAEIKNGTFREDLYYRLAVVELVVPPLRDRPEDIPALAMEFARRYGEKFDLGPLTLEPALVDALVKADWPGNVRQLENTMARLTALTSSNCISLADYQHTVPARLSDDDSTGESTAGDSDVGFGRAGSENDTDELDVRVRGPSLREQVEAFERGMVARMLESTGGNQSEAARRLGVSRVTLIDKIKKYGLGNR